MKMTDKQWKEAFIDMAWLMGPPFAATVSTGPCYAKLSKDDRSAEFRLQENDSVLVDMVKGLAEYRSFLVYHTYSMNHIARWVDFGGPMPTEEDTL